MEHKEYKSYFEKVIIDIESEMKKYLKKNSNETDSNLRAEKYENTMKTK